jgi:two-component system, chemotaxis family, chemotaxis protein CheY
MRILIVDDEYVCRMTLKSLLSKSNDCDIATDGPMALAMFAKAHEDGVPYDLITMDVDMPGMSGPEVVGKIRQWEQEHKIHLADNEAKILMITVQQTPQCIVKSFREGCEWYLMKPVRPANVQAALAKLGLSTPAAPDRLPVA